MTSSKQQCCNSTRKHHKYSEAMANNLRLRLMTKFVLSSLLAAKEAGQKYGNVTDWECKYTVNADKKTVLAGIFCRLDSMELSTPK